MAEAEKPVRTSPNVLISVTSGQRVTNVLAAVVNVVALLPQFGDEAVAVYEVPCVRFNTLKLAR